MKNSIFSMVYNIPYIVRSILYNVIKSSLIFPTDSELDKTSLNRIKVD